MKMNKRLYLILGLVCLLNLAAHLCFYPQMPEVIPIHWGSDGAVDGLRPPLDDAGSGGAAAGLPGAVCPCAQDGPQGRKLRKSSARCGRGFIIAITLLMAAVSWLTEAEVFGLLPRQGRLPGLLVGGPIGVMFILLATICPGCGRITRSALKRPGRWRMRWCGSAPIVWAAWCSC